MIMKMRMMNVDLQELRDYIKEYPKEFPRLEGDVNKIDKASRISIGGFVKTLANGRPAGYFTFPREDILFFEAKEPGLRVLGIWVLSPVPSLRRLRFRIVVRIYPWGLGVDCFEPFV